MIDAPLGLTNILTVVLAVCCLWTTTAQTRASIIRLWRLSVPAVFAAVVALVLLAGVFDATLPHDGEWVAGLVLGSLIGRSRGHALAVEIDRVWGLVRLPSAADGVLAATGIVILSMVDFASAALQDPVTEPIHVAAAAAFCAGFIGCPAVAIMGRSSQSRHVELHTVGERSKSKDLETRFVIDR